MTWLGVIEITFKVCLKNWLSENWAKLFESFKVSYWLEWAIQTGRDNYEELELKKIWNKSPNSSTNTVAHLLVQIQCQLLKWENVGANVGCARPHKLIWLQSVLRLSVIQTTTEQPEIPGWPNIVIIRTMIRYTIHKTVFDIAILLMAP